MDNGKNEVSAAQKALDDTKNALPTAIANKQKADSALVSASDMKDAIRRPRRSSKMFLRSLGIRLNGLAQDYAANARGKTIRNATDALAMFDKYKGTHLAGLSTSVKGAIANAFKAL